ncbi:MAG: UbiD family decarboxylase, partial [Dehalococcoidia bacterium]|nr:UbiD family decarboxylase [Dehalococcoidia bacterium]
RGYDIPLAFCVHGSHRRVALSLELPKNTPPREIFQEFCRRWDRYPIRPIMVNTAPCKEVKLFGEEADLTKFPIVRWNPGDGGPYIDKAAIITRDPETGILNFGMYRAQLKGPRTLNVPTVLVKDIGMHYHKAQMMNKPLEIVLALGLDPSVHLTSVCPLPADWDEFAFAGALRGEPLEIAMAETVDLPVPAHAEIIIEGEIPVGVYSPEGPFGEFTGYYPTTKVHNEIHVKAITHRTNPIFEGLYIGLPMTENDWISHAANSASIYKEVKSLVPEIEAFNLASTWCLMGIASLRKLYEGHERKLMNAVWATPMGNFMKCLFVVDADIDPFNIEQVLWAMSTRFQADSDIVLMSNSRATPLDPSGLIKGLQTKIGLDLTWPVPPAKVPAAGGVVKPHPVTEAWKARIKELWEGGTR